MKPLRLFVTALVGMTLLVQGVAVAASPTSLKAPASMADMAKAPCHMLAAAKSSKTCCDSDCPDMSACALGHIAAGPAPGFAPARPDTQRFASPRALVLVRPPQFLLRPPIALHA